MEINFAKRSSHMEIMDNLDCKGEVVDQTLYELDLINQFLRGNEITIKGIDQLLKNTPSKTYSIIDLGCGSGKMLQLIETDAARKSRSVNLTGIDGNSNIVHYAREHSVSSAIDFKAIDIFSEEFQQLHADVFVATLFLHHFDDEQLIQLFQQLKQQAKIGIVVNDLHRHPLAYYSFKLISTLFSKSAMVKFDGPLSVLRAFKKEDLKAILAKAGIENYSLAWKWAFRWQLIIKTSN